MENRPLGQGHKMSTDRPELDTELKLIFEKYICTLKHFNIRFAFQIAEFVFKQTHWNFVFIG